MGKYTVQNGDLGYSVIAKKLGIPNWQNIASANSGVDTHQLRVGQQIEVPGYGGGSSAPSQTQSQPQAPATPQDTRSNAQRYVDSLKDLFNTDPGSFETSGNYRAFDYNGAADKAHAEYDPYFNKLIDQLTYDTTTKKNINNRDTAATVGQLDTQHNLYGQNWDKNLYDQNQSINGNFADNNSFFSSGRTNTLDLNKQTMDNQKASETGTYDYNKTNATNHANDFNTNADVQYDRGVNGPTGLKEQNQNAIAANINTQQGQNLNENAINANQWANNYFNSRNAKIDAITAQYGMDPAQAQVLKNNTNIPGYDPNKYLSTTQ